MPGQSVIVGIGALGYPAEFEGADKRALAELGVSKTVSLSSTYDHRVIQGAESGLFLAQVHELLCGADGFYHDVFRSLGVPYEAVRWRPDSNPPEDHDTQRVKQVHVQTLINMYRVRGHLIADLDPLRWKEPQTHPELDPATYGLTIWDLDREFYTDGVAGRNLMTLGDLLGVLRDAYCRRIGVEYMHIQEPEQKRWIQEQVEGVPTALDTAEQLYLLGRLNAAEAFERFLHTKYVGHKRFGLEGAESLIPLVDEVLDQAAVAGIQEAVLGMAHRGRLNLLANIVGKPLRKIFREFEGNLDPETTQGSGDVKYHLGAAGQVRRPLGADPAGDPGLEPLPPGGGRPGGGGHGAGQAGPHRRPGGVRRPAPGDPRRRRLRRPGGGGRDPQPVGPAGLPGGGHHPRRRQQPARLHHRPRGGPVVGVRHRRGQDGPGPDLPRQRRRSRGVPAGGPPGVRLPPAVPQGRRGRHGLLPPPRPQRGRRPVVHPAPDVQAHRGPPVGAQALHRDPRAPGRHHRRGGGEGPRRLPGPHADVVRGDPPVGAAGGGARSGRRPWSCSRRSTPAWPGPCSTRSPAASTPPLPASPSTPSWPRCWRPATTCTRKD